MYDFLLRADYSAPPTFGEGGGDGLATEWTWVAPATRSLSPSGMMLNGTVMKVAEWLMPMTSSTHYREMKEGKEETRGPGLKHGWNLGKRLMTEPRG
ncbi:MAG: hypothetical protein Ct9H300mP19_20400 [Dehalococcoidia bacterium]|nr:MAG: hypothetical protein Ct9H300mP19_20400 [Dehalococcoidia bacterium]